MPYKFNPYRAKYSPAYLARHLARLEAPAKARAKARKQAISALRMAIIRTFRSSLAPALSLPAYALIGIPTDTVSRSWFNFRSQLKRGANTHLPPLFLPLLSYDRSHPCLWLWPCSGILSPGQRYIMSQLQNLGHSVAPVQTITQAQMVIRDYIRGPL